MSVLFGSFPSQQEITQLEMKLTHARIENWLREDLFTWQWWLLVAVLVLPWFLWWRLVDKKRLTEIFILGTMILIAVSYMDAVLSELGLWSYKYEIIPLWPRLISADFTVLPVTYMLIYQYCGPWKKYIIALVAVAAFYAFGAETLLKWLDFYHPEKWEHIYSFPIYIALGMLARWQLQVLLAVQQRARQLFG
jgi:hypothetical protein